MWIFSSIKTSLISTGACFGTFIGPRLIVVSGLFGPDALFVLLFCSFYRLDQYQRKISNQISVETSGPWNIQNLRLRITVPEQSMSQSWKHTLT